MTIQTIPRRLPEVGRLRLGERQPTRNGQTRPAALASWRLTSKSRFRLEAAAKLYGGTVRPWADAPGEDDQWELYTEAKALRVCVIPTVPVTQFYEHWTGGGCQRRCDGITETISGDACLCAMEAEHPADFTCKPTTRLSVLLPDLPGLGVWRCETHGYYGAAELAATAELLASLGRPMPVALVIDQRSEKRPGQPRRDYVVPMLDSRQSFMDLQMLAAADPVTGELPAPAPSELELSGVGSRESTSASKGADASPAPASKSPPTPVEKAHPMEAGPAGVEGANDGTTRSGVGASLPDATKPPDPASSPGGRAGGITSPAGGVAKGAHPSSVRGRQSRGESHGAAAGRAPTDEAEQAEQDAFEELQASDHERSKR